MRMRSLSPANMGAGSPDTATVGKVTLLVPYSRSAPRQYGGGSKIKFLDYTGKGTCCAGTKKLGCACGRTCWKALSISLLCYQNTRNKTQQRRVGAILCSGRLV